ncbi:MAG: hypothetical protein KIC63_07385, partial [Clostridium sp.]|nr:hypothetical protein [Clostridium sp.]
LANLHHSNIGGLPLEAFYPHQHSWWFFVAKAPIKAARCSRASHVAGAFAQGSTVCILPEHLCVFNGMFPANIVHCISNGRSVPVVIAPDP